MAKYKQGKYTPRYPAKYDGNPTEIIYRSSWEYRYMHWLDNNIQVLKWSSETTVIPYVSPKDSRFHRYFVDFKMTLKNNQGKTKTYLVEVKPEVECSPPKVPKRQTPAYINRVMTYGVNQAKWKAAELFANQRGWTFVVITERHLDL
jgi:hypothetical protein